MIFDQNDFIREIDNRRLIVYAREELTQGTDRSRVFLISHQMSNTGAPIELFLMAKSLCRLGYLPVVFSLKDGPLSRECEREGIPVIIYPDVYRSNLIDSCMHLAALAVVNTIEGGALIRKLNGCGHPVIWWIHESEYSYTNTNRVQLPVELEENIHVFCIGKHTGKVLSEIRPNYAWQLLPTCVADEAGSGSGGKRFSKFPKDKTIFLHVGTLVKLKGQDILLEAAEKLDEDTARKALFVFVGQQYDPQIKELIDQAVQEHPDRFLFLDEVSREKMGELYSSADCCVCTSRSDAMPAVIVEAMMHSKPVIVTSNAGASAFVQEGGCGLVYSGEDTDELAESISKVITGDCPLETYRENARKTYLQYFSEPIFDANIKKIAEQYSMPAEYKSGYRKKEIREDLPEFSIVLRNCSCRNSKGVLKETVESVLKQEYRNWELLIDPSVLEDSSAAACISQMEKEDHRIHSCKTAPVVPSGRYTVVLENGILLKDSALQCISEEIKRKAPDFVYSDHADAGNKGEIIGRHYKPDYAPDTLRSGNYIGSCFAFRTELLKEKEQELSSGADVFSTPVYSLVLKLTEVSSEVAHISCILWEEVCGIDRQARKQENLKSLTAFLEEKSPGAQVEEIPDSDKFRIRYQLMDQPLVSILICNRNHYSHLKKCIASIREKTTYPNYEIIIIDNGSDSEEVLEYYRKLEESGIQVLFHWMPFNYSRMNNLAATNAKGEYLLLLNNDMEVITPSWIEEMMMYCQRQDVGAVGAMLYFPNDTIQHAGAVLGMYGLVSHVYWKADKKERGYDDRLLCVQNLTCVTGACLMVRAKEYREANGLDEELPVTYNDIDFCVRLREKGLLVVWTPFVALYHDESSTRGSDFVDERNSRRNERETRLLKKKWKKQLTEGDPYYNKNFDLNRGDYL